MSYAYRGYSGRRRRQRRSIVFLLLSITLAAAALLFYGVQNGAVKGSPIGRLLPESIGGGSETERRASPTPVVEVRVSATPIPSEPVPTANAVSTQQPSAISQAAATKVPTPAKRVARTVRPRATSTVRPERKRPARPSPTPGRAARPSVANVTRRYHTVVPGDNLYSISDRYNVAVSELAAANGLDVQTEVYIDQQLLIPTRQAPSGLRLPPIRQNPRPPKLRSLAALSPELVAYMESRAGTMAGAVFEPVTGTLYVHQPNERFYAASTIKVPIMLTLLSRGNARDGETVASREPLLVPMIVVSDNEAASTLFTKVGGQKAVQAELRARGLANTRVESDQWGLSTTTAPDMARLMRSLYLGQRLTPTMRRSAVGLLGNVVVPQRWGVPAGVPDSAYVAFKGGWLERGGGWQVHQIGVMQNNDRTFVFALMTAGQPAEVYGRQSLEGAGEILGTMTARP